VRNADTATVDGAYRRFTYRSEAYRLVNLPTVIELTA
jgi:hypothetical protein